MQRWSTAPRHGYTVDVDGVAAAGWNDRPDRSSGVRFDVTASPASSRPRFILYHHDRWDLRRRWAYLGAYLAPRPAFLRTPRPAHTRPCAPPSMHADISSCLIACWSPWSEHLSPPQLTPRPPTLFSSICHFQAQSHLGTPSAAVCCSSPTRQTVPYRR